MTLPVNYLLLFFDYFLFSHTVKTGSSIWGDINHCSHSLLSPSDKVSIKQIKRMTDKEKQNPPNPILPGLGWFLFSVFFGSDKELCKWELVFPLFHFTFSCFKFNGQVRCVSPGHCQFSYVQELSIIRSQPTMY